MSRKDESIYIQVLKFAHDHPGFSLGEIEAEFPEDYGWIKREVAHSKLFQTDSPTERRHYLSFDDAFRLLEYEELQEARRSSGWAMFFATVSLLIAAASLAFQTFTFLSAN